MDIEGAPVEVQDIAPIPDLLGGGLVLLAGGGGGDNVVVGRIVEVQQKRWKVDIY